MNIGLELNGKQEPGIDSPTMISRITLEHVFYGLILVVGAVTRFYNLGHIPLSPEEALQSLSVWTAWQAGADSAQIISPAFFTLTTPLTQLFGYSDSIMRLIPTIFGIALVLVPWWLRSFTGRLGALIAALLIAVSPLFVITSRTANGSSIALFAGLLLVAGWLNFQNSNNSRWFYVMSFALGLGLTSGTLFYSILFTFTLALIGERILGPALFKNALGNRRANYRPDSKTLRNAALIFAATLLLIGTGFLLRLSGIGATARILSDWLVAFLSPASLQDWLRPVSAFLRYELLVVILGGSAVIWATWRGKAFPMLLVYWFMTALLLMFIQRGIMENTLVLSLAGVLLIAAFVDSVLSVKTGIMKWLLALTITFVGIVIYINLGRYSRLLASDIPVDIRTRTYHLLLIAIVTSVVLLILAILWSSEKRASIQGLVLGLLILLIGFSWSTALWLAKDAANDTREPWVLNATDGDIRLLAATIQQASSQVIGSDVDLDLVSTIDHPSLAWYLRDMRDLELGGSLSSTVTASGILTEVDRETQLANDYTGIDLAFSRPESNYTIDSSQFLNRWLFHENLTPINEERLIFWLRSDLMGIER
jgi:hypothetical protein